jgi:glutamate dehydrogenase
MPGERAMASTIETKKAVLVHKAEAFAAETLRAADEATRKRAIAKFYEHVPPSDVAERSPRDLCGAALSLLQLAERRRPGQAKIRVFNPDPLADGWSSPHTIVEVVNDDMPFLVDSVTGAINLSDRVVHLVVHPIVNASRDAAGRLLGIGEAAAQGRNESWMQIEITPESDPSELARLTERLSSVLADVRAAVEDWRKMRAVLRDLGHELAVSPPLLATAEIAEARDFLRWLDDDNFTFLGYREYRFDSGLAEGRPALGILREARFSVFGGLRDFASLPSAVRDYLGRRELLLVTKSNQRASVHRTAPLDAIGVRAFGPNGEATGIRLFLGLFTSLAYSRGARAIPLLRQKVRHILERSGLSAESHDGKALLHILDSFPRDELFQASEGELYATVIGILNLQERQRTALFIRRDPLERFVSALVYVPRDRYDTALRQTFAALLEEAFAGTLSTFYTHLDESVFARIQFLVATTRGKVPAVEVEALEKRLAEAARGWSDRFEEQALAAFGEEEARARLRGVKPFPIAYRARTEPAEAVADLGRIKSVAEGSPLEVALRPRGEAWGLRIYRAKEPVALSDMLPILENLGLRVIAEEPFRIDAVAGEPAWIHELSLAPVAVAARTGAEAGLSESVRALFAEALVAVWTGRIENDGFNRLVLAAGLSARQIVVLRLYGKFLRQARALYSQAYMEETLARHAEIARRLVRLFEARFDPQESAARDATAETGAIENALEMVESLDEDRILRSYLSLIQKTVRTNFFQALPSGRPKPYLAIKLASSEIALLPLPRPLYEIYVYSPKTEGVHLRAGKVARGGIRWSERKEDFRAEILGLMKAQTVKNAVIVAVGAKGGFILKEPPKDPEKLGEEAVACYKILIRGLLDLTDNIVADGTGGHRVVPPRDVVRRDGDDPYLVVAADKGTASFSDIANAIAEEYGFWLGDAFASGGSAGYDHKALGITSRGAWKLVERHFRELGRDIAKSEFTVVGVGDMSGDVFGNAMRMSRRIRLLAAFDHRHVFIDPDPDPEKSFAERERLFHLPHSSWADYDKSLLSEGGGVFERSAKSIAVSPAMKQVFAIAGDHLTPAELIRELLKAPVDLLWFGGIGTFVKGPEESHAEIGDRANDAVRINGDEIRANIVGEGANLGVSERGRIAYALQGGRIDTDTIDNSAGVDTSDHEVNIKILLDGAIAAGALAADERRPLLSAMAVEVAELVLRDNELQGEALSLAEAGSAHNLDRHRRLIGDLERRGLLDRALEFLPDEETLAERAAKGKGLLRPELAVLLAYAKMALDRDLLASDLPDAPELAPDLAAYFPSALRGRLGARIGAHPLCREILATILANDLVNRAGLTFVSDMRARTSRSPAEVARAYLIVREVFDLRPLWGEIEALDNKIPADLQTEMRIEIMGLIEHAAAFLLHGRHLDLGREMPRLAPHARYLRHSLQEVLPPADQRLVEERAVRLAAAGVPRPLACAIGGAGFLASALEVAELAETSARSIESAARVYYGAGARFALDELRAAARRLPAATHWQKLAVEAAVDDAYALQADLCAQVLASDAAHSREPLSAWAAARGAALAPVEALARELGAARTPELALLVVALRQLRQAFG